MTRSSSPEYDREYRKLHVEQIRAYRKSYRAKHRKKISQFMKSYRQRPDVRKKRKELMFRWGLKFNYGLTPEAFHSMLAEQGGMCAICKKANWGKKTPYLDHDHNSKAVRGILCVRCNTALGMINDDIKTAKSIVVYLKKALPEED